MSNSNGPRTGRPPTRASRGLVSTPHYLASEAGNAALRKGGSAIDAAISANAVLCVVYPHMAGLGGDGFWLIAGGGADGVEALDASGPSAKLATIERYRRHGDEIPMRGPLAALTVPGAVDGWREAHERHGRLPWGDLFADAIHYAREGIPVSRSLADWLATDFSILSEYPDTARIFLPDGKLQRDGARLVQADLARSLETIAADGARAFYEGDIAQRICGALEPQGSPLRPEDFAEYRAEWVDPISTTYRGYESFQMPPSTQGFAALQILNLLEGFDVQSWGEGTADYYHHIVEAVKVAFADRDEWLTDPKFVDIPLDRLLDKEYAAERRKLIDPRRALDTVEPGIRFGPDANRRAPGGDTVYFCVVDDDGLAVSKIQSPYHDFGSAFVAGDTGILMQNRGSFFSLDDRHPNRLEPGKRTFHTIIPAMLLKDGRPVLAYGSMGGEGQPQTQAAMITRIVDFGFDVQQAIEAPHWLMGAPGAWSRAICGSKHASAIRSHESSPCAVSPSAWSATGAGRLATHRPSGSIPRAIAVFWKVVRTRAEMEPQLDGKHENRTAEVSHLGIMPSLSNLGTVLPRLHCYRSDQPSPFTSGIAQSQNPTQTAIRA